MKQVVITSGMVLKIVLLVMLVLLLVRWVQFQHRKDRELFKTQIFTGLTVFYICIIFSFTLLPITYPAMNPSQFELNLNMMELLDAFSNRYALISYVENILLFMPLTILAYCSSFKVFQKLKWGALLSFAISFSVEALQGVEAIAEVLEDAMPVCDINDLICNTIGGIIGFFVICFYKKEHPNVNDHAID